MVPARMAPATLITTIALAHAIATATTGKAQAYRIPALMTFIGPILPSLPFILADALNQTEAVAVGLGLDVEGVRSGCTCGREHT